MSLTKSLGMKNFIFKSNNKSDLYKIFTSLQLVLTEQRCQRADLSYIKRQLNKFLPEFIDTPEEETQEIGASNPDIGE